VPAVAGGSGVTRGRSGFAGDEVVDGELRVESHCEEEEDSSAENKDNPWPQMFDATDLTWRLSENKLYKEKVSEECFELSLISHFLEGRG
jgi:hypothetical protein